MIKSHRFSRCPAGRGLVRGKYGQAAGMLLPIRRARLAGDHLLDHGDEKAAQSAALLPGELKGVIGREFLKKNFREILCVARALAGAAQIGVNRIPVTLADVLQGQRRESPVLTLEHLHQRHRGVVRIHVELIGLVAVRIIFVHPCDPVEILRAVLPLRVGRVFLIQRGDQTDRLVETGRRQDRAD